MEAGTTGEEERNARRRLAPVAALALIALVALQGTALAAGTTTGFEVRRVQSLPVNPPPPLDALGLQGMVASPLNYGGSGAGNMGVSPSRCLILRKPISDTSKIAAPTSKSSLPVPLAR